MTWSRFLYGLSAFHAALSEGFALAAGLIEPQPEAEEK